MNKINYFRYDAEYEKVHSKRLKILCHDIIVPDDYYSFIITSSNPAFETFINNLDCPMYFSAELREYTAYLKNVVFYTYNEILELIPEFLI